MKDLILPLKSEYFNAIKDGSKLEEYRLCTPFWKKRLEGKTFRHVVLTLGYPKKDDHERRLVLPWRGYTIKTIQHKHFGPDPVEVFAINVSQAFWFQILPEEVVRSRLKSMGVNVEAMDAYDPLSVVQTPEFLNLFKKGGS